jgi:hypothetical protein
MATTNKGLLQPVAGTTSWDVPLNANFGYIDSALGGTSSISVTGVSATPVVLTEAQYRSLGLYFNGTLTANVTYQIPAGVGGQWVVSNDATGAFTVSIGVTGTGGLVSIPQGFKRTVYSTGTGIDFSDSGVVKSISGGSTGLTATGTDSVTLGGTLAVASGGTGATTQGGALNNIVGFTPVQQGGPLGTGSNKIYLGWKTDNSGIIAQVDGGIYLGRVATVLPLSAGSAASTQITAPGDMPLYACRAWVNFNGTGSPSIRASGNVTSITDTGFATYSVNFTTAMPDINYAFSGSCTGNFGGTSVALLSNSTTVLNISTTYGNGSFEPDWVNVIVFR